MAKISPMMIAPPAIFAALAGLFLGIIELCDGGIFGVLTISLAI